MSRRGILILWTWQGELKNVVCKLGCSGTAQPVLCDLVVLPVWRFSRSSCRCLWLMQQQYGCRPNLKSTRRRALVVSQKQTRFSLFRTRRVCTISGQVCIFRWALASALMAHGRAWCASQPPHSGGTCACTVILVSFQRLARRAKWCLGVWPSRISGSVCFRYCIKLSREPSQEFCVSKIVSRVCLSLSCRCSPVLCCGRSELRFSRGVSRGPPLKVSVAAPYRRSSYQGERECEASSDFFST